MNLALALSLLVVDLSEQSLTALIDGVPIVQFAASTGTSNRTPIGEFRVREKSATTMGVSPEGQRQPWIRMDWMIRFVLSPAGKSIGIHSVPYAPTPCREEMPTPLGVAPSTRGCVRLANADAAWIYQHVDYATIVQVRR